MKNLLRNIIIFLSLGILHCVLIGKEEIDKHPDGGPSLTLNNETSFTLNFPFSFKPEYKTWSDLRKIFSGARSIPDLPPNAIHTETFDGLNFGQKGVTFEILSTEWPREKRMKVHIPKPEGPLFMPFWDDEHEIYGGTVGINYNIEWSDEESKVGWEITFFEEEVVTDNPEKEPSPLVKALKERNNLKEDTQLKAETDKTSSFTESKKFESNTRS